MRLQALIRPSGTFRVKARRILAFLDYLFGRHGGRLAGMFRTPPDRLRAELLAIPGIGPETADAILLYAGGVPEFVADAYTRRVFHRHYFLRRGASYEETKALFHLALPRDALLFNEYHALIVELGKVHCRTIPRCRGCPLESDPHREG